MGDYAIAMHELRLILAVSLRLESFEVKIWGNSLQLSLDIT